MKKSIQIILILTISVIPSIAQMTNASPRLKSEAGYIFTTEIDLKATTVKNQARTNTCWSFATTSFIESELIRMGKGEYDLSEMYIVRENYLTRLKENFLRKGKGVLGEGGGLPHDWLREFKEDGIVPDAIYPGLNYQSAYHNHDELQAMVSAVASVPVQRNVESREYLKIINSVLDTYLGDKPEKFLYNGVKYTPRSFAEALGIDPGNYIEISSYTHFPLYSQSVLEVPDNWAMEKIYNVSVDEMIQVMDYSLTNGYTFVWDGDVSENGFSHSKGIAIIPEISGISEYREDLKPRAENMTPNERLQEAMKLEIVFPEVKVTQELRQEGYETSSTTDDHGMHITGLVKDQTGKKYYKTKNSWGTDKNLLGGYLYMSENYVRAKTILILVNINGIPSAIKTKLGI